MSQARVIVIGNEKGGAGKSTIAIHLITALLHGGATVGLMDLDLRQESTARFFSNRKTWNAVAKAQLPEPTHYRLSENSLALAAADPLEQMKAFEPAFIDAHKQVDFLVIDTPGGDTGLSRTAHGLADLVVTPMNDSFVDFDLLGHVDPVTLELLKPSIYSLTVWEARKAKAVSRGKSLDWVVLRNRLAAADARNRRRVEERMVALSRRVGFRIGPGLRDRVIYRELFPFGLTVADLSPKVRPVPVSLQHIAARQELRALMHALGLGDYAGDSGLATEPQSA